jgi:CHAT domain-containing protein
VGHDLGLVIDDLRRIRGFSDFLRVPADDDVASAAQVSPLVYLCDGRAGGLALVVTGDPVRHVPLPGLTTAALRERVRSYLDAYARYRADPRTARSGWDAALDGVTGWLWDAVMGPVLAAVDGWPELVFVPGGRLGLLPMHAAWTPDGAGGRRYALDAATISVTPGARVLRAARRRATAATARLFAVADPQPVAASALPMARVEVSVAAAAFPAASTVVADREATFLAFEWQAPDADVLHLACHGIARPDRPLDSALLLAGGQLSLRRLLRLRLRARLAVLSACETALPGTELPDEVVALSTGLLEAGVAGVVASQWAVPDRAAAMLMTEFYRGWRWQGLTPAVALRGAQRWLRDTSNAEKRSHFTAAMDAGETWLPRSAGQSFLDQLRHRDGHEYRSIHNWGAFTHVGA